MLVSRKMPGAPKCLRRSRNPRGAAAAIPRAGTSLAVGLVLLLACLAIWTSATTAQPIPADAQATATVPPALFASWFESGTPTLNGVVKPADSIAFANDPGLQNVDFYQWSEQMFLWLTSPAPITYGGGGGRIFSSPAFFDVSPPDQNGVRTFIPHVLGEIRPFPLRVAKVGPRLHRS
jgi:hypothetical protein